MSPNPWETTQISLETTLLQIDQVRVETNYIKTHFEPLEFFVVCVNLHIKEQMW